MITLGELIGYRKSHVSQSELEERARYLTELRRLQTEREVQKNKEAMEELEKKCAEQEEQESLNNAPEKKCADCSIDGAWPAEPTQGEERGREES